MYVSYRTWQARIGSRPEVVAGGPRGRSSPDGTGNSRVRTRLGGRVRVGRDGRRARSSPRIAACADDVGKDICAASQPGRNARTSSVPTENRYGWPESGRPHPAAARRRGGAVDVRLITVRLSAVGSARIGARCDGACRAVSRVAGVDPARPRAGRVRVPPCRWAAGPEPLSRIEHAAGRCAGGGNGRATIGPARRGRRDPPARRVGALRAPPAGPRGGGPGPVAERVAAR